MRLVERLVEVMYDVLCILDANGHTDDARVGTSGFLLLFCELAVHHACRMCDKGARIS